MRTRGFLGRGVPIVVAAAAVLILAGCGQVERHESPPIEPEEVAEISEPASVTIEDVAVHIEQHVAEMARESGSFSIRDDVAGSDLQLALDKVHRERLSETAPNTYFVCADFVTPEGKVYDLDFWVENTGEGLLITESMVHKEDGTPRYNWFEKDGTWVPEPA